LILIAPAYVLCRRVIGKQGDEIRNTEVRVIA
jgi:hypothetical protein